MKAIVWTNYGPPEVLRLGEAEKPTPKANEVLIRIYATTVTAGDREARNLKFPILFRLAMRMYVGLIKPKRIKILGQEFAGELIDVIRWRKLLTPTGMPKQDTKRGTLASLWHRTTEFGGHVE